METARLSLFACLALAAGLGTWYLHVRVPENHWWSAERAGQWSMGQERFGEAERQFMLAVDAARVFRDDDPRRALSLFHLAQALVAQSRNAEAISLLEQSAAMNEKALRATHPEVTRVRAFHAAVLRQRGGSSKDPSDLH